MDSVNEKLLSIFRTSWVCETTSWTINFKKSKYRASVSEGNVVFELRCAISVTYTSDFKDLVREKEYKICH